MIHFAESIIRIFSDINIAKEDIRLHEVPEAIIDHPTMPTNTTFPLVNACLNALAAVFLGMGYYYIKRQNRTAHRNTMIAAFCTSSVFLASYLWYHTHYSSGKFRGLGAVRVAYFSILISHIILAVIIVPLAIRLLVLAKKQAFVKHRRLARTVWPLWMYTSITGVIIYLLLYQY